MFKMAELLGAIFTVLGTAVNSTGLCVNSFELLPLELGPLITAVYFTKLKSTSSSYGPLFLKGILSFCPPYPFLIARGIIFSLISERWSSF